MNNLSIGELMGAVAAAMFVVYLSYRISKRREELRRTVVLMTEKDKHLIDDLDRYVTRKRVRPIRSVALA